LATVEELPQDLRYRFLSLATSQIQKLYILLVCAPRLLAQQGIVGPPIRRGRIEIFPIHVAGKGSRLADQPANHVAVVDTMLVLATQPLHTLHQLLGIPDLDLLQADPHFHGFADQPRWHRVGIVFDANRTQATDAHALPLQRLQAGRRQPPHRRQLLGYPRCPSGVAGADQVPQPLFIGRAAGEVPAATQQ